MLIPEENEKDLAEIPDNVKKGLEIVPVSTVDEVLEHALTHKPTPIEWEEEEADAKLKEVPPAKTADEVGVVTH